MINYFLQTQMIAYKYKKSSVKFICSSRWSRASQSPFVVEKQLKPHAEYANLPTTNINSCVYSFEVIYQKRRCLINHLAHTFLTKNTTTSTNTCMPIACDRDMKHIPRTFIVRLLGLQTNTFAKIVTSRKQRQ